MLNFWQCKLVGLWKTIKNGVFIKMNGCDLEEIEHHKNVEVLICKCTRCGGTNISWGKNIKP
jgi:hypothetical protein